MTEGPVFIQKGSVTDKYAIDRVVGTGSYGKVYAVTSAQKDKLLCCKKIMYSCLSSKAKELVTNEIDITMKLDHPNIVKYYEVFDDVDENSYSIIMDYYKNGDMLKFLTDHKKHGKKIDEDLLWAIMIQVLLALSYCHSPFNATGKAVIHRDIKPANLLIGDDMQVKLADFGVCRLYENAQEHMAMTIVGTPIYMPPESFESRTYTTSFDIWSLGCTMYELAAQKYLITGPTDRDRLERARKMSSSQLSIPGYSAEFVRIISAMIKYHPDDRPSASDIIKSPEVQSITKKWAEEGRYGHIRIVDSPSIAANAITINLFGLHDFSKLGDAAEGRVGDSQDNCAKAVPVPLDIQDVKVDPVSLDVSNAALKPLSAGDLNDIILKSTTPLIDAVKDNDIDGVKRHIDSHKRKQRLDGMTALMIAAVTNNVEAGRILLDDEKRMRSLSGFTALLYAIENRNLEFARLMASHERDIKVDKISPRAAAEKMGMNELLPLL